MICLSAYRHLACVRIALNHLNAVTTNTAQAYFELLVVLTDVTIEIDT